MRRALRLATRGAGQVSPNPKVGAVVVCEGRVVGEGWHARFGGEHAEAMAVREAGEQARGATVYVTLEPCNHQGKTPPCSRLLIDAGVARVVYAIADPNPVAAGGADALRRAGVAVHGGTLAEAASELDAPFLFAARGATRPFVTLKLALSIDGAIARASRARQWLTGQASRRVVHALRADADAVAVGIGTAMADDPELTVRDAPAPRVPPSRVVFDRQARLAPTSVLVRTAQAVPTIVLTERPRDTGESVRQGRLVDAGVTVLVTASLDDALRQLRVRDVRHLFVEGGAGLASSLLQSGLVDRLITFQAPVILGAGALAAFASFRSDTSAATRFRVVSRRPVGDDLMSVYAVDRGARSADSHG